MDLVLLAAFGFAWASGAAFLITIFAAFMSTGRSENELWRRFSVLSAVNTIFCFVSVLQNHPADLASMAVFTRANLMGGMLLGPAFLDFVLCFAAVRGRVFSALAWTSGIVWCSILVFAPGLLISEETTGLIMPLHFHVYRPLFIVFLANLFGIITYALIQLFRYGLKMPGRTSLMRFVLPSCAIWAACGFWDTTLSLWFRIPLPLSWAGGALVNIAFLAFVTRRSQEAFRVQEKHKSFMRDVGHAREIQMGLITTEFPVMRHAKIVGKYMPMQELGGDFYAVRRLDHHRILLFISDVTGHGIASAFITAMMKISLESLPAETLEHPEQVLNHLNEALLEKIMDRFITGIYGILDEERMTFRFCSAGHHPPALHYSAATGEARELQARGRLLGAFDTLELQEEIVQLSPGDRLLLATDGIYEAFDENGEMYGIARLKDVFAREVIQSLDPLFLSIHRYTKGARQADDMAGLLICVDAG